MRVGTLFGSIFYPRGGSDRAQAFLEAASDTAFVLLQFHGHLLDDFDSKAFQRCYFLWAVGQQPNSSQIQIRKNLCADADFALRLSFVIEQPRQFAPVVKA